MASPLGHTLAGLTLLSLAEGKGGAPRGGTVAAAIVLANLPDLDFLPGLLAGASSLWHHRWTHSLGFAALVSVCILAATVILKRPSAAGARWAAIGGLLVILHLVIDLFTGDDCPPVGLQVLWPLSEGYFSAPVSLFLKVERGPLAPGLVMHWWRMALRELVVLGIPLAAACIWRRDGRNGG